MLLDVEGKCLLDPYPKLLDAYAIVFLCEFPP